MKLAAAAVTLALILTPGGQAWSTDPALASLPFKKKLELAAKAGDPKAKMVLAPGLSPGRWCQAQHCQRGALVP